MQLRPTYHTRALRRIQLLMTLLEAAETLSHDNVTARLDYCNSLRHGTLTGNLYKYRLARRGRMLHAARPKHLRYLPTHQTDF